MPEKPKRSVRLNSRLILILVAAILLLLGLIMLTQELIDTSVYRAEFIDAVKAQTGRTAVIKGRVSVSLFPSPTLFIPGVELRDAASDQAAPAISVDMVKLHVPLLSFLSRPHIDNVTLVHPVLELVRAHDNIIHWEWLNLDLIKGAGATARSMAIVNGVILYHDNRTDKSLAIENINMSASGGNRLGLNGEFSTLGHTVKLSLDTSPAANTPADMTPLHLRLNSGKDVLDVQGGFDVSGDAPKIKGTLSMDVADMLGWMKINSAAQQPGKLSLGNTADVAQTQTPLPLKITGDLSSEGVTAALDNVKLDGLHSAGSGKLGLSWQEWRPAFAIDMDFASLNYLEWKQLFGAAFLRGNMPAGQSYNATAQPSANPMPGDMQIILHASASEIAVGAQKWQKAALSAKLEDAAITVNQYSVELPSGTALSLFGIISQGTTSGLRFEGSMETSGASLRQTLAVFDESASDLPETGFGDFSARANIFISSEQMRLSDADVKLTDLHLNGGLVAYFEARPRIEADVKLKNISFDYFRDAWRDKTAKAGQQDFFLKFDRSMNFNWLKKLQTNIDLKVDVDHFTFLERKGDSAGFRIGLKEGEFSIYDMRFTYPSDTVDASFNLDVRGDQPTISIIFNADALDTSYFNREPPKIENADNQQPAKDATAILADKNLWSSNLIDMSWMDGYNANFDISVGKLTYGKLVLDRLKFQAALVNNLLTFKNFSFAYWQGRCSVLGAMYGGTVPGISVSFTLFAAELQDIMKALTGRDNLSGKVSISGTLTTSGVNYLSWVSQSDAKLVLAGRGVHVNGINMQGVVDAVGVSRTAADVFNNVNLALVNGSTDFSVDGTINVSGGVMKTPGIALRTGLITGDMTGELRLIPWTMDLSTLFQFPSITSETIPTLFLQLSGPVTAPAMHTDTASLESYVAKHIIGK